MPFQPDLTIGYADGDAYEYVTHEAMILSSAPIKEMVEDDLARRIRAQHPKATITYKWRFMDGRHIHECKAHWYSLVYT